MTLLLHIGSLVFCVILSLIDLVTSWSPAKRPQLLHTQNSKDQSINSRNKGHVTHLSMGGGTDEIMMFSTGPVVAGTAFILGIAAQSWINNLVKGDRGLGAYLQDGDGYSGSGFSENSGELEAVSGEDPLPWLKLPRLDFVEVAGQEDADTKLQQIRRKMNDALEQGKLEQATELRIQLEEFMSENGFEYTPDESK
mmetsp:Transcript_8218/g.12621  ORF Transcript_8218/g.12621 Transcript_8218/m.12621 type:complete len:196 (-) Transcript_8218:306-893(-)|eukprot:CAMPEP_0178916736 /NCGR_PEP_ID=MMETSP0786-20121207/12825_1 /TAXON_ID=186022 /ORGANISM="Thalassionema frauenfeldii, Strain CCMP 1798" /LENGTH=195 /DNA_ID=CAMNT_0020590145 /DNA_START=211 /DNA_END=798 /DNA_ORIENTATION=-